MKLISFTIFFK